jgi:hypothetical protein
MTLVFVHRPQECHAAVLEILGFRFAGDSYIIVRQEHFGGILASSIFQNPIHTTFAIACR